MKKGTGEVQVTPGSTLTICADGEFTCYGYTVGSLGDELTALLGPAKSGDRRLVFRVPRDVTRVKVKVKPQTQWTLAEALFNGQEHPDPTPLEIPFGYGEPESLEESMKRFVREEVSRHYAEQGLGTFEEEDDFDVEDDEPELISQYEMHDMQEEAPLVEEESEAASVTPAQTASVETAEPGPAEPEPQEEEPAATPSAP